MGCPGGATQDGLWYCADVFVVSVRTPVHGTVPWHMGTVRYSTCIKDETQGARLFFVRIRICQIVVQVHTPLVRVVEVRYNRHFLEIFMGSQNTLWEGVVISNTSTMPLKVNCTTASSRTHTQPQALLSQTGHTHSEQ